MLCEKCEKLPPPTNVAGVCRRCQNNKTEFFAYKLCLDCSEDTEQCERCEKPLFADVDAPDAEGPTPFRIVLTDADNGQSRNGMHPGEEIIVRLEEDQYSQTEWGTTTRFGDVLSLKANNGFTPYPGQYQKGIRELLFEVYGTGTEDLVLEEKTRVSSYWSTGSAPSTTSAANGRTWKVTIQST